jgi:glutamate racemase
VTIVQRNKQASLSSPTLPESNTSDATGKIGLFDSGVGGLSVLSALTRVLPNTDLVYFADQKYCPYGARDPQEIRARSQRIVEFLLAQNCRVIVVACNTASAAALYHLRATFPDIPFIGMEPAVKPAAYATHSRQVAVLATKGTLEGELFAHTRDAHAREVQVHTVYPEDWVERVERGEIDSPETEAKVRRVIEPLLEAGVDEIALGCTHYPFLSPLIEKIAQGRVTILDPSDAVAKQTANIIASQNLAVSKQGTSLFYTSGEPKEFARVLHKLIDSNENCIQGVL